MKKILKRIFGAKSNANESQNKEHYGNQEQTTDPKQIVVRENIKGTPFWINKVEEKGWFITLKGYQLTEAKKTRKEAIEEIWLENNGWNVIGNMIIIIHEQVANEAAKLWDEKNKYKTTEITEEDKAKLLEQMKNYNEVK